MLVETILQWRAQRGWSPPDPSLETQHRDAMDLLFVGGFARRVVGINSIPRAAGPGPQVPALSAGGAGGLTSPSRELPGNREGGRERLWPPLTEQVGLEPTWPRELL